MRQPGTSTKQFGLRAELTYSDNSKGVSLCALQPGCEGVAVCLPGHRAKESQHPGEEHPCDLRLRTERNVAYFDNLSLTQEVAQTMKYDKDGKLVSVKSTGNEEESSEYENGNLKELVTGGNGRITTTMTTSTT